MSALKTLPSCTWTLHLWTAVAMCMFAGCVDTTRPWDEDQARGTGGRDTVDGALPLDSAWEASGGGTIDVGIDSAGGAEGGLDVAGGDGELDASINGAGGSAGADGSSLDVPLSATDDARDHSDGETLSPLGGMGGRAMTGGRPGTGGTSGVGGISGTGGPGGMTSSGGVSGPGGATGTGGAGTGGAVGTGGSITTGLLAYYKCDETAGSRLVDSSGNGNHGTLHGSYLFGKGKAGNALTLVSSGNGYASLPTKVFAGVHDITIATWVYVISSHDWQRVFDTGIDMGSASAIASGAKYMNLTPKNAGSDLRFSITVDGYNGEESLRSPSLATGVWTHVAIVLDEAQAYGWLYIDGSYKHGAATAIQPDDLGAIDYAWLGRSQFRNDSYFDGRIDEFRVYDRVLSAEEIEALYKLTGP